MNSQKCNNQDAEAKLVLSLQQKIDHKQQRSFTTHKKNKKEKKERMKKKLGRNLSGRPTMFTGLVELRVLPPITILVEV